MNDNNVKKKKKKEIGFFIFYTQSVLEWIAREEIGTKKEEGSFCLRHNTE